MKQYHYTVTKPYSEKNWQWEVFQSDHNGNHSFRVSYGETFTKWGAKREAERRIDRFINPPKPRVIPVERYSYPPRKKND